MRSQRNENKREGGSNRYWREVMGIIRKDFGKGEKLQFLSPPNISELNVCLI